MRDLFTSSLLTAPRPRFPAPRKTGLRSWRRPVHRDRIQASETGVTASDCRWVGKLMPPALEHSESQQADAAAQQQQGAQLGSGGALALGIACGTLNRGHELRKPPIQGISTLATEANKSETDLAVPKRKVGVGVA